MIKTLFRYDVDIKVIDTTNVEDVGSMSKEQFNKRFASAHEPDLDDINFLNQLAKI